MHLGPSRRQADNPAHRILGTVGVPIGGNDFDSRFIRHLVAPELGAESEYRAFSGKLLPMPQDLYAELERWDKLSFLKTRQTLSIFEQKFSPDRLRRGGELTSVASGLALCALKLSGR